MCRFEHRVNIGPCAKRQQLGDYVVVLAHNGMIKRRPTIVIARIDQCQLLMTIQGSHFI